MLVLSRKEGEKLVIGNDITLVVTKISGNRITLGIEAPSEVKIVRGELRESISAVSPTPVCKQMATRDGNGQGTIVALSRTALTLNLGDVATDLDKQAS